MNLKYFGESDLFTAMRQFFHHLEVPVHHVTNAPMRLSDVLKDQFREKESGHTKAGNTYFLGLVDDMAFAGAINPRNLEQLRASRRQYKGLAIFGVEMGSSNGHVNRTELSSVIRSINRSFLEMPVMVIFRHGHFISLAAIERREYRQEWREGEKMGKVYILKDVNIQNPHAGHLQILKGLKIDRIGKNAVRSYEDLYQHWQKVLNVSILNKKFYQDLQAWFSWAVRQVEFPEGGIKDREERNAVNVIRMITRIMFVWFLKERKLVPEELFNWEEVARLLKPAKPAEGVEEVESSKWLLGRDKTGSTYYKAILQNLFFATLNTEMDEDLAAKAPPEKPHRVWVERQTGVQGYFRYKRFFSQASQPPALYRDIPFLNGGLFENLDRGQGTDQELRVDCFSNREDREECLKVPDWLFFQEEKIEIITEVEGKGTKAKKVTEIARGLFPLLKSYKFTIAENTPYEMEVALDPELLGKVFENLLAAYNPETRETARRETGSFYTPREIVEYMVDESLIAHLLQHLPDGVMRTRTDPEDDLRALFSFDRERQPFREPEEKEAIIRCLNECKILDPACGSGAFPMGILQKMVHVLGKLDPQNELWKAEQIRRAREILEADLQKAREFRDDEFREKVETDLQARLNSIEENFDPEGNELDFARKLHLIENCIYGVDIQPVAVQIAKLRFFISLLVEQKINNDKPNRGIIPLPNLETRFVTADSLIAIRQGAPPLRDLLVEKLEAELMEVRRRYFRARTPSQKDKARREDKALRDQIRTRLGAAGWPKALADKIADWNMFDQNGKAGYFDPEWMFGVREPVEGGGFDIVIGNPPYVQIQKFSGKPEQKAWETQKYETFVKTGDIYSLFYERGYRLLREGGLLAYITSNKWMRTGYGEKTRKFFAEKTWPRILIDFGMEQVFESATTYTNILLFRKGKKGDRPTAACRINSDFKVAESLMEYHEEHHSLVQDYGSEPWVAYSAPEYAIKSHVVEQGVTVGHPLEWGLNIFRGILTGNNDAFVISKEEKDRLIQEDPRNATILKPMLRGRDIRRWYPGYEEQWLICSHNGVKAKGLSRIDIPKDYPSILRWLQKFGKKVESRTDQGNHWTNLRNCAYLLEFEKPKIIYPEITKFLPFCYDESDHFYSNNKSFIVTGKHIKYLTAILNSSLFYFCFKDNFPELLGNTFEVRKIFMEKIPIKVPTSEEEVPLERMTEYLSYCHRNLDGHPEAPVMAQFFERLADGLVYELYFGENFREAGKSLRKELGDLPPITDMKDLGHFSAIRKAWKRLSAPEHRVAYILATMNEIPEVALMDETAKQRSYGQDYQGDD